ncbi:TrkA family potassium uptake protein [Nodosilinea sp. P-1105]|uniref:potassium channel family protein n=1 Tax=Nodosilinea sp. P-1105 TaxID=2546229 RepID=UPI00146EBECC|nr:TrkA family potassium uptake protein [Nodosilinea sp. P-1105]NMF83379.1 TrkA family potassium uptake protein [Nodosilinea sp. P-1105]
MAKSSYFVVVGCGRLGALLSSQLSSAGHSVVTIDIQDSAFRHLALEFSGFKVTGDATEMTVLRKANIERADCLLAVTDQDNLNLMVAQVAKIMFDVPVVMARVYNPMREAIYKDFGIATISPTQLSAQTFLDILSQDMQMAL